MFMETSAIDKEMYDYFMHLNEAEKNLLFR